MKFADYEYDGNRDEAVLEAIAGKQPNEKGWAIADCPFCGAKGKLSFSFNSGWFKCHKPSCGKSWTVKAKSFVRLPKKQAAGPAVPLKPITLPPEFVPIGPSNPGWDSGLYDYHLNYLRKRNVTLECIDEHRIGACLTGKYGWCVVIPQIVEGEITGFVARHIVEKVYRNMPDLDRTKMLNIDALWIETDVPVAIVEGPFDHLPHWPHCVSCLGKWTDAHFEVIKRAKRPVIAFLDADARAESEALEMMMMLETACDILHERSDDAVTKPCTFVAPPPGMDPGGISHDLFLELTGIGQFLKG